MKKFLNRFFRVPKLFIKNNVFRKQHLFLYKHFTNIKSFNKQFPPFFKSILFYLTSASFIIGFFTSIILKNQVSLNFIKIYLPIIHITLLMKNPRAGFLFQTLYCISLPIYLIYSPELNLKDLTIFLNQTYLPISFGGFFICCFSYILHSQLYKINQLKHKLSTLNENYEHLSKNLPGVIYQLKLDEKGIFSVPYVNPKIRTYFKITQQDVLENAQCWISLVHPDNLEELLFAIKKSANHMSIFDFKSHFLINGQSKWFHFKSKPIKFEDCILWNGLCLDITKQMDIKAEKNALEEKTKKQMLHLKTALKECKVATWERTWNDTKFWWSDDMYELLDVAKHTTPTLELYQSLLSKKSEIQFKKSLFQLEHNQDDIEYKIFLKHKSKVLLSRIKVIRHKDGSPKKCYGTLMDISETHQAQKALESAKEKQSLAEKKVNISQQFLANISHELRTPLHCILGFTKLLIHSTSLTKNQRNYLNLVISNSKTLQALIDQLLELNKISQNILPLNLSKLYIKPFIEHYENSIQSILKQKCIRFFIDFDTSTSFIYADPLKLEQILNNLITNAIEHCSIKGTIILNIKSINDTLHLTVSDTGPGISDDIKPIMFDQFNRFGHPFKRSKKGNGLGLAISKNLVQQHQGKIWLNDTKNGTSISFSLPIYKNKYKSLNQLQNQGEKIENA